MCIESVCDDHFEKGIDKFVNKVKTLTGIILLEQSPVLEESRQESCEKDRMMSRG